MGTYILRRLTLALPVLVGITIISFAFTVMAPGDALDAMFIDPGQAAHMTPEQRAAIRRQLGLEGPAPVRYAVWMGQILQGNLGRRLNDGRPIASILAERVPKTIELMGVGLGIAIVVGITLGVVSALKQYSLLDYVLTVFGFVGLSVPEFFAALAVIYLVSFQLNLLPTSGYSTPGIPFALTDHLPYLVLPATVLALERFASVMRYARTAMLDVFQLEYVTTARSKGLRERIVVVRHVLPNALIPLITIIGLLLPGLIGGAIFVETIFLWPGMASLYIEAITARDHQVIMALVLVSGAFVVFCNLLADVCYGIADPRIRYD